MFKKTVSAGIALTFSGCKATTKTGTLYVNSNSKSGVNVTSDPTIFVNSLTTLQNNPKSVSNQTTPAAYPLTNDWDFDQAIIDQIGSDCADNTECNGSTFCCSKGRCVPGSICYKGQK